MYTTLNGDAEVDIRELQARVIQLQQEASDLQNQIDALNSENSELLRLMSQATSTEEYNQYQATYNSNRENIRQLQSQLDAVNRNIAETRQAIEEAEEVNRPRLMTIRASRN